MTHDTSSRSHGSISSGTSDGGDLSANSGSPSSAEAEKALRQTVNSSGCLQA
jgi:hypothetical protein